MKTLCHFFFFCHSVTYKSLPVVNYFLLFVAFLFVICCQQMALMSPINVLLLSPSLSFNDTDTSHEHYSAYTTVAYLEQIAWEMCLHISHSSYHPATKIRACLLERCERHANESQLILAEVPPEWPSQSPAQYAADCRLMSDAIQD